MEMSDFKPVRVGNGNKVHAGVVVGMTSNSRFATDIYKHLCGSGKSSLVHNHRKPSVKVVYGKEIDCKKCLEIVNQELGK